MAAFDASGWSGIEIGTEYQAAKTVLTHAGVRFEEKTVHKTGMKLLAPKRDGWDMNTVYFEWDEKTRKNLCNQILFIKEKTDMQAAKAVLDDLVTRHGKPSEVAGPITIRDVGIQETHHLWKNPKITLKLTVTVRKDGTVAVFENWGRP